MNLVVDEAAEIFVKDVKPRRELGTRCFHVTTTDIQYLRQVVYFSKAIILP